MQIHLLFKFLTTEGSKILANALIDNQFNYASLIWMFPGKLTINKVCKIHYRILQVVYSEYQKFYDKVLQINKDIISIHQKHLRILALEVYKIVMHFNPEFM